MKSSDTYSPEIKPMETLLTKQGLFRIFEEILHNQGNRLIMREAYGKLVDFCVERNLSLTYSDFISFKTNYYKQIHRRERALK